MANVGLVSYCPFFVHKQIQPRQVHFYINVTILNLTMIQNMELVALDTLKD